MRQFSENLLTASKCPTQTRNPRQGRSPLSITSSVHLTLHGLSKKPTIQLKTAKDCIAVKLNRLLLQCFLKSPPYYEAVLFSFIFLITAIINNATAAKTIIPANAAALSSAISENVHPLPGIKC